MLNNIQKSIGIIKILIYVLQIIMVGAKTDKKKKKNNGIIKKIKNK